MSVVIAYAVDDNWLAMQKVCLCYCGAQLSWNSIRYKYKRCLTDLSTTVSYFDLLANINVVFYIYSDMLSIISTVKCDPLATITHSLLSRIEISKLSTYIVCMP